MTGRNDLCPCGSRKKYKRCCGAGVVSGAEGVPGLQDLVTRGMGLLQAGGLDEAESCFRQALARAPGDAGVLNLLGVLALRRGKFEEGGRLFGRAIAQDGGSPDFYNNLAHALRGQGKLSDAVKALKRAIAVDANYFQAYHNLGNALDELGQTEQALTAYRKALALQPGDRETMFELGSHLARCGQLTEAESLLRRVLLLHPNDAKACFQLAEVLEKLGGIAEAEGYFKQAMSQSAIPDDLLARYGAFLARQGRFKEAERLYESAIRERGDVPGFYYGLTRSRKFTKDDEALLNRITDVIGSVDIRSEGAVDGYYALGKAWDDLGKYDRAFPYYQKANQWQGSISKFNRRKHQEKIDWIIRCFAPDSPPNAAAYRNESVMPILVVGMPRSGTTLVEQILSSHSDVSGAGELDFWRNALKAQDGDFPELWNEETLRQMGEGYLRELERHTDGASHVVDKMPGNYMFLGLIHRIFPKAKIIHCRRDPVDTCLSIYFQQFSEGHEYRHHLGDLAFAYRQYRRLMDHWKMALPASAMTEVSYEDLVASPEMESRRLIEFCGLSWDERCLEFYKNARTVRTASQWQVRQPIYQTSKERWRNYEKWIGPLLELRDEG